MLNKFLTSHKLATLPELRYLMLEVLDRNEPISWYDLSFSCKEHSLNLAFAFENSMTFLHLISLVRIHADRSVSRIKENYDILKTDHELGLFIMRKTVVYLEANKHFEQVFNTRTIMTDATSDIVILQLNEIPENFLFVRSLLLNLGIIAADNGEGKKLPVAADYRTYFQQELLPRVFTPPIIKTMDSVDADNQLLVVPPTFFISYADKDAEFKNELQKHFSGLKMKKLIKDWEVRAILPGQDWEDETRKKLEQAQVVLFLISSDFMASEYINDIEIKKTIERYKQGLVRIIPIIVRPCDFDSLPIRRYMALPDGLKAISQWANRDEAYLNIVNRIKEVIKKMSNTSTTYQNEI